MRHAVYGLAEGFEYPGIRIRSFTGSLRGVSEPAENCQLGSLGPTTAGQNVGQAFSVGRVGQSWHQIRL